MTPSNRRILCVDDNRDAADSTAEVLALLGYETRACYDGPSALALAESFRPDVCVLDLNMPGMDGDVLAGRLRPGAAPPLLVAVSAATDPGSRRRICDAGFDRHLAKPAALGDLLAALGHQGA
ncbi:histidine kinase : Response regulator OS=Janthinobacterium agaricidamnosum NBRC 102515 = DSM 9628 GN=GJA_2048 PE=4 SV=1: Response_reg [Gemmataceae bacterium]|nr:histidine kinase : Response regulator OS=Janthinobacterium agaricidamnosum NBRC 102515 = DSM 9628 GN=GJA_2048 PE=4 SV=1: Response_reg [Gemmataceae bacterium]VTT99026.1 histidine kinase : Response regulator OS=Janthinobacterium agaricidamnosum NBRC 102515 = DSM 9628 GN=GJA_2048 PE=4 SV=1: Response_reg [Gemmataceae bacterium]